MVESEGESVLSVNVSITLCVARESVLSVDVSITLCVTRERDGRE